MVKQNSGKLMNALSKVKFTGCEFYSDLDPEMEIENQVFESQIVEYLQSLHISVQRVSVSDLLDIKDPNAIIIDLCMTEGTTEYKIGNTVIYSQDTLSLLIRASHPSQRHPQPNLFRCEVQVFERYNEALASNLLHRLLLSLPIHKEV